MRTTFFLSILLLTIAATASIGSVWGQESVLERMEAEIGTIVGSARPVVVSIRADRRTDEGRAGWQRNVGSGVVLDSAGYILTAECVIRGAERIEVIAASQERYVAEPIGFDIESGLSVVRVREPAFSAPPFGDSDHVQIGRWTLVVGNSMGMLSAAAAGLITGFPEGGRWMQINAQIVPGNGGAPLFDRKGNLIGIVIGERCSPHPDPSPRGAPASALAIPINEARRVAQHLIADGRIAYGWLGVTAGPLNPSAAKPSIVVCRIVQQSPAHEAGILRGDLILTYNGYPVENAWDLAHKVRTTPVGQQVDIELLRGNQRISLPVRIQERMPAGCAR
ncbi:MAG: S1C family serine protease [Candidatus Latescibacterota bacterium]